MCKLTSLAGLVAPRRRRDGRLSLVLAADALSAAGRTVRRRLAGLC